MLPLRYHAETRRDDAAPSAEERKKSVGRSIAHDVGRSNANVVDRDRVRAIPCADKIGDPKEVKGDRTCKRLK